MMRPRWPSTMTSSPLRILCKKLPTPTTAGISIPRATIAVCPPGPPASVQMPSTFSRSNAAVSPGVKIMANDNRFVRQLLERGGRLSCESLQKQSFDVSNIGCSLGQERAGGLAKSRCIFRKDFAYRVLRRIRLGANETLEFRLQDVGRAGFAAEPKKYYRVVHRAERSWIGDCFPVCRRLALLHRRADPTRVRLHRRRPSNE